MKDISKKILEDGRRACMHVCKVGIHHKNNFDEVMPIVQVSIGNCEIMDVLLDGDYGIKIISKHLQRKLGFKKPHLAPFMVRMIDHRKV
jgi:hypothetical protein